MAASVSPNASVFLRQIWTCFSTRSGRPPQCRIAHRQQSGLPGAAICHRSSLVVSDLRGHGVRSRRRIPCDRRTGCRRWRGNTHSPGRPAAGIVLVRHDVATVGVGRCRRHWDPIAGDCTRPPMVGSGCSPTRHTTARPHSRCCKRLPTRMRSPPRFPAGGWTQLEAAGGAARRLRRGDARSRVLV